MAKPFEIMAEDVRKFAESERLMYASLDGKRFILSLKASKNKPYIVRNTITGIEVEFSKIVEAVKFFNELRVIP